jgi:hypothetical protein
MIKYRCRETFGPYTRGESYDTIPTEMQGTGVFVRYNDDDAEKAAPSNQEEKSK